jgi:hypothetical protein
VYPVQVLVAMAESDRVTKLEDLCRQLVRHVAIPERFREKVDEFVESVIADHHERRLLDIQMLEIRISEQSETLDRLTKTYKQLVVTLEGIKAPSCDGLLRAKCDAKDVLIKELTSHICKVCAKDMPCDKTYANRCGHVLCQGCWNRLEWTNGVCPFCRDVVVRTHRIYL